MKKYFHRINIINKGMEGERHVTSILENLNNRKYYIINNLMLKRVNSKTSQIDHVIISRKGLFVIETKNYSGLVQGNAEKRYWSHVRGSEKHTLYNIIYQNQGHINVIKQYLNYILAGLTKKQYKKFFVSIILFNDNCIIKIKKPLFFKMNYRICKFKNLIKYIKKGHRRNIISKKQFKEIISELESKNIVSNKNVKKHIKQIKHKKY